MRHKCQSASAFADSLGGVPVLSRRPAAQAPLLAIVAYLTAGWSVVAALGLAGLTLAVHVSALSGGVGHPIGACVRRPRESHRPPGEGPLARRGRTPPRAGAPPTPLSAPTQPLASA